MSAARAERCSEERRVSRRMTQRCVKGRKRMLCLLLRLHFTAGNFLEFRVNYLENTVKPTA